MRTGNPIIIKPFSLYVPDHAAVQPCKKGEVCSLPQRLHWSLELQVGIYWTGPCLASEGVKMGQDCGCVWGVPGTMEFALATKCFILLFLRSPAISLGFTIWGEIFSYVAVFLIQPLRLSHSVFVDGVCWVCFCYRHSPV